MDHTRARWQLALPLLAATALGHFSQNAKVAPLTEARIGQSVPTVATALDQEISTIEKQVVEAAEAMPEDKFDFSPESLHLPGADYTGVRTFALQVKHVAASNYALWAPLTGDSIPQNFRGGTGPDAIRTKGDIMKFLRDSYAMGHRAAATLTTQNMLQPPVGSKSSRLHLATFGVAHAYDHYGQMVEYLRMNGILPPASRPTAAPPS
jgi:hypothetical protein